MEHTRSAWVSKYLLSLGLEPQLPDPDELTYDYLRAICTAHLNTFAFENISKLLYYRDRQELGCFVPPVEVFVEQHAKYGFGGTCFSQNANLFRLLQAIGFQCHLVKLGDEHMAILVQVKELGGERVYVDCGAAAPFFMPVRFETDLDNVSQFGTDRVLIRPVPGSSATYEYTRYQGDVPSGKPWRFEADSTGDFDAFGPVVLAANVPGATFMTLLRCQLWQLNRQRSVSLVNHTLTIRHSDGTSAKRSLRTVQEIEQAVADEFGLPNLPIREAVDVLADLGVDILQAD